MLYGSLEEILPAERMEQIEEMTWAELQSIVPDLQALGFWVTAWPESRHGCALSVKWHDDDPDFLGSELDRLRRRDGDTVERYVPTGPPYIVYPRVNPGI